MIKAISILYLFLFSIVNGSMGDQPANILINGVPVDLSPPGEGSVTRVILNKRVDDMVNVTRHFSTTIGNMAANFHGAYDKHVDELEKLTDDMSKRIIELKEEHRARQSQQRC